MIKPLSKECNISYMIIVCDASCRTDEVKDDRLDPNENV